MKKAISITLDEEIIEFLENESKEQDRSVSYIVNEILKKENKK